MKAYLNQDFILFLVSECGCAFIANHFEFLKWINFEMYTQRPASLITSKTLKYKRKCVFKYVQISVKYNVTYFRVPPPHMGQQPLVGQGLHIVKASRSRSDTPHSLGLLWTSDQYVAETFLLYNT